jgi:hypothetical protein
MNQVVDNHDPVGIDKALVVHERPFEASVARYIVPKTITKT